MSAGKYDLVIEQGADFERTFILQSSGSVFDNGTSGWSFRGSGRANYQDASALFTLQVSHVNVTSKSVYITIPNSVTAGLTVPRAFWDFEAVRASDGFVMRLLAGDVLIKQEATK